MKFVKIEGRAKTFWVNPATVTWVREFADGVVLGFGAGDGLSINGIDILATLAALQEIEA